MNALFDILTAAGITLTVAGDKLRYTAPAGALTPELRQQIATYKAELLALLAAGDGTASRQDAPHGQIPPTLAPPMPYSDVGQPDAVRASKPYRCWYDGCTATADGPWQQIGPDCWQADCEAGHLIQRTAESFDGPPDLERGRPVLLPAYLPDQPLPLWLYDQLHPAPGVDPLPAPPDLTDEQIAGAVDAARQQYQPPSRYRPKPQPARDPDQAARILAAGLRLGWPALALRPGECLAAGEDRWRRFAAHGQASRLEDALRASEGATI